VLVDGKNVRGNKPPVMVPEGLKGSPVIAQVLRRNETIEGKAI
jgi:hypothetical protein